MKYVALLFVCLWSFVLTKSIPVGSNLNVCSGPSPVASKFFLLNNLVFLSDKSDSFEYFRIFNLSSGDITERHKAMGLIPNLALQASKGPESLLWAFSYDVDDNHCVPNELTRPTYDSSTYCARVENLKGLVVACLSSHRLVFMRHNAHKFMVVHDQNNFLEMNALLKHLDRFGFTSSLTFDQNTDQFVSTHYGRLGQICVTITRHRGQYVLPLPLLEEIINDNLFDTECISTPQYTSVIDLHGQLYATTGSGMVDRVRVDLKTKRLDKIKSTSDKEFLNCFHNSSVVSVGRFPNELGLLISNDREIEYDLGQQKPLLRSFDIPDESLDPGIINHNSNSQSESKSGGGGFWSYLLIVSLIIAALFGVLLYTKTITFDGDWFHQIRDSVTDVIGKPKDGKDTDSKKTTSTSKAGQRQFSSLNLSQWVSAKRQNPNGVATSSAAAITPTAPASTEESSTSVSDSGLGTKATTEASK